MKLGPKPKVNKSPFMSYMQMRMKFEYITDKFRFNVMKLPQRLCEYFEYTNMLNTRIGFLCFHFIKRKTHGTQ